mgnify:CR=1 FL=1
MTSGAAGLRRAKTYADARLHGGPRRAPGHAPFPAWLVGCIVLCGLLLLNACQPTPSPSGTAVPKLDASGTRARPTAEPTATSTGLPNITESTTATPSPAATTTPAPTPTPTPPPLPDTCLRQQFADDVQICQAAPRYDIDLTIDPGTARVTGRQQITYTNAESEPLDGVVLRLLPNAPGYGGVMTVTHLLLSGQSVPFETEPGGTALRVPLQPALQTGRTVRLSMDFAVEVPTSRISGHGLFSYVRGVMALPTVYPLIPAYHETGWHTEVAPVHGDDVFADVAIYNVEIEAPSSFTLIATGACGTPSEGTWTCKAAPMRDFTLILGESYKRAGRETRGVVVNSYFYEWHEPGGGKALEVAVDALEAFTDFFGPYPYTELDVVETPNYLGGMEYSGLVVVEDGLYPGVSTVEWLTAHEVAHQWWMVVVGNDQINEPWLDEALTQYSTMLYYEAVYGKQRAESIRNAVFVQSHEALRRAGRDMPAGLPADAYPSRLYFDIVYDKGALYFHELRERVGDDVFFNMLKTYYSRHRYQIATTASFLDTVEDVTGDRHLDLYNTWISPDA